MFIVPLTVKSDAYMESQSELQRGNPQIFARYEESPDKSRAIAFVVVHPTSNFHDHYLASPLAERGAAVLALNTRYIGNDSMLIMERAIQDLGAGFQFLKKEGYERIVLIGNSGGGSLATFYQQQAEHLTISTTPDGRPIALSSDDFVPADAIALVAAHPGRAAQLLANIDGSVISEDEPNVTDAKLDMFNPVNGPRYDLGWVMRYRLAQAGRMNRITARVLTRLAELESTRNADVADEAFIIHRTQADPRNLDVSLDANNRKQGTVGQAKACNLAANGLARFCTLRSYLSQWCPTLSRAHGPTCLATTKVPVLVIDFATDQTVFASHAREWRSAAGDRGEYWKVDDAAPYPAGRTALINNTASKLVGWARDVLA